MVDSGPNHSPDFPGPTASLQAFRKKARQAMDDLAFLRWRLGGIVAVATIAGLVFFVSRQGEYVPTPEAVDAVRSASGTTTTTLVTPPSTIADFVVDVAGAVLRPGVYTLDPSARVADAIAAAGGLADGADRDRLNFAEHVMDGQRITVLKIGQSAPEPVGPVANGSASANSPVGPLNINTATAAQLDSLPGVGPATARAIISYRSEHGPFATIEELASVKGIGPAKLTQLKELVRV